MRTIFVVRPGRLFVKEQDAIDEFGYIEFAMASRDDAVFFSFRVLPHPETDQKDLLRIARHAGNTLLLHAYANIFRRHKGGKNGKG